MCLQVLERLLVLLLLPLLLILPRLITYFNQSNKPSYSLLRTFDLMQRFYLCVSEGILSEVLCIHIKGMGTFDLHALILCVFEGLL